MNYSIKLLFPISIEGPVIQSRKSVKSYKSIRFPNLMLFLGLPDVLKFTNLRTFWRFRISGQLASYSLRGVLETIKPMYLIHKQWRQKLFGINCHLPWIEKFAFSFIYFQLLRPIFCLKYLNYQNIEDNISPCL